ncbi:MAG TPA: OmpH family outer membrane protein [Sphingomicrobium sp.]|nr:OmpH family outer membrane protein [Sphingomicrobium sp.]
MQKLVIPAAIAASLLLPAVANAQALPGAVVAVVDLDRVTRDCNACKTASAALRSQASAIESRAKALGTPLETEAKSIQTALQAAKGSPDAALQARIKSFQEKQQSGSQEIDRRQAEFQRNQQYVQQQVAAKLGPIYQSVMQKRGANLMVEAGTTLATAQSIEVTTDVITALNAALPSISTTAPATQQPQGR